MSSASIGRTRPLTTNITPAIAAFFTTSLVITRQVSRLREMADEALLSIHRKLIDAEERERTRIARELHDDINQRIALMALDLEQLEQTPSESVAEVSSYIQKLVQRLSEIGADLHAISPRNRKLGFAHGTGSSPG